MNAINLIRPVLVKVKVTEAYKRKAATEVQEELKRVELELKRLAFQEKQLSPELEKKNPQAFALARQRLQQENNLYEEKRRQLLDQLRGIGQLTPGTEVLFSKMESPVELKIGDEWSKVLGVEIIIEDGIVVEIRHRGGRQE